MITPARIADFLAANPEAICAELSRVRGSSPRNEGAFILVGLDKTLGTIGGGALEYMVIDRARQLLGAGGSAETLDVPLGPEIGQCCGGRVEVSMGVTNAAKAKALLEAAEAEMAGRPNVYLFGAGHVGHALARALVLLPLKIHVIDTRPDELAGLPEGVAGKAVAMPEAVVRTAPRRSSFVILTHDHALDFLIGLEALKRSDAPYIGMIGSRTKRARFSSWYLAEGGSGRALERLVMPIGMNAASEVVGDKRPEVIAALAASEIMVHIGRREVSTLVARPDTGTRVGAVNGR